MEEKKNVLVCDPLSYSGHVNYNHGIIRNIKQNYKVGIIVNDQMERKLINKGVDEEDFVYTFPTEWGIVPLSKRMNKVFYHIMSRYYLLRVLWKTKTKSKAYDKLFITCIDIYTFVVISIFFRRNCFVVDHGIGNVATSRWYKWAWRLTNSDINIVVLEPFIKDMVQKKLKKKNVFVIRHPLPEISPSSTGTVKQDTQLIFAPSGSNDESFIKNLCKIQLPNGIKIVIKSHLMAYNSEKLIIYKDYISDEDYQSYINNCQYILLAYKSSYNFRISAVLFEALMLRKIVLLYSNNTLANYQKIFPSSICLFSTMEELFGKLAVFSYKDAIKELEPYSDSELAKSIRDTFNID